MEIENKFYTPSLEEFHAGFEFEFKYTDGTWHKTIILSPEDFFNLKKMLSNSVLRVKMLDREDIESCGFDYSHTSNQDVDFYFHNSITLKTGGEVKVQIRYDQRTNMFSIDTLTPKWDSTCFSGKIKNKSEFKIILEQTEINKL